MKYVLSLMLLVLILTSMSSAADYRSGRIVYITGKDTVKTDLFAGAETVTISGTLLGDLFAGCKHLDVKGEVKDDVIAGCKDLRISSKVGDQVIGLAQTIIIDSEIGGDVLAFAEEVRITKRAHILGNLHVGTANLFFEGGTVEGKIFGGADKAFLNGTVMKNVDLGIHKVDFGEDYEAFKGTKLKLHEPLEKDAEFVPDDLEIKYFKTGYFFQSWFFYWSLISMLIVGFLLVTLFKNFSYDLITYAKDNIWKNLGTGALIFIAVPVAFLIILIFVVTIPIALMMLAVYLILLYLSSIITGIVLGNYCLSLIKKNGKSPALFTSLLLGILLIVLIPKIPFLGWLFSILFICFGIGTLVLYIYQISRTSKQVA